MEVQLSKAAEREIRDIQRDQRECDRQIMRLQTTRHGLNAALRETIGHIIGINWFRLTISGWPCETSPTRSCIYDTQSDAGTDECLFCGEPLERK